MMSTSAPVFKRERGAKTGIQTRPERVVAYEMEMAIAPIVNASWYRLRYCKAFGLAFSTVRSVEYRFGIVLAVVNGAPSPFLHPRAINIPTFRVVYAASVLG